MFVSNIELNDISKTSLIAHSLRKGYPQLLGGFKFQPPEDLNLDKFKDIQRDLIMWVKMGRTISWTIPQSLP